jgi:hypothetical protein
MASIKEIQALIIENNRLIENLLKSVSKSVTKINNELLRKITKDESDTDDEDYDSQDITTPPQQLVDHVVEELSEYLPKGSRKSKMEKVRSALINAARDTTGYDRKTAVQGHWNSWKDTEGIEKVLDQLLHNN